MDLAHVAQTYDEEKKKEGEARERTNVLVALEDIMSEDVEPPKNVLFVCKLNKITTSEDLETLFIRFGDILTCQVVKDWKTGDSLQYAFIEFKAEDSCVEAYLKMNNVLIDERRIKVDFSQSVSKLWNNHRRGQMKEAAKSIRRE